MAAAKAFYSAVLGWELEDQGDQYGNYHMARRQGADAAGVAPPMGEGQPSVWTLYFASDDAAATARAIAANGGQVVMDVMAVPEDASFGRMVIAADPTGAMFGVWEATGNIGVSLHNAPGGLAWEDLRSPDPVAAREFYDAVFGFTHAEVDGIPPGADYKTFAKGGPPLGGMGDMMGIKDVPPHWAVYFGVENVDAALQDAAANGGTILSPGFDTPYGRMGCLNDPAGATFWVVERPDAP
jgi:predicted enzyme related to lactoylglutathione lyase